MIYTSIQNEKIKDIAKLSTKKYRDQTGSFLIEGAHLVEEAFKSGLLKTVLVVEGYFVSFPVATLVVSESVMKHLSSMTTIPNIMGICKKNQDIVVGNRLLLLDEIQDPGNLGSIIRSAVAFGIDTLILSPNTVDLYNPKVIRATQGLLFHLNIVVCDLVSFTKKQKREGYSIYATHVKNGKAIKNLAKSERFAIIMGNEGAGVQEALLELADHHVMIPMSSNCESLNVGVAAGIILYEFWK